MRDADLMFQAYAYDRAELFERVANSACVRFVDALQADALIERARRTTNMETLNFGRDGRARFEALDNAADSRGVRFADDVQHVAQIALRKELAERGFMLRSVGSRH
jgi:hypothetical protein